MKKDYSKSGYEKNTKCPRCNYQNLDKNIERYGSCRLCGYVLDKQAKFRYEMYCRLKLWKSKKTRGCK